jgi:hypothetical protein
MLLMRVQNPDAYAAVPEAAMDVHLGVYDETVFFVIGERLAIPLNATTFSEPDYEYLRMPWVTGGMPFDQRVAASEEWLDGLRRQVRPTPVTRNNYEEFAGLLQQSLSALVVHPLGPLPPTPARPALIYGHLPFGTTTEADTLIYRWEAFPRSRRIDRTVYPPTIADETYAAPASELPFAPTGFAAVGRFALPSLLPAIYRYEIQPELGTMMECGASVPLYGQSGGGVEVKFVAQYDRPIRNRGPMADPVVLPAL